MELTKETILIVDDSRFHRTVIKELFSDHFHLLEAVSGLECMRIIKENAENIVKSGFIMPSKGAVNNHFSKSKNGSSFADFS